MLQSISWYQFFCILGAAGGLYYVGAFAYFYLEEVKALFKGEFVISGFNGFRTPASESIQRVKEEVESLPVKSRENDDVLIGRVSDLVDEIKSFTAQTENLPREKAESIFSPLLKRYHTLVGTHYQETISLFIADTLSDKGGYEIDRKEVHRWWPSSELKQVVHHFQDKGKALAIAVIVCMIIPLLEVSAQDGNAGINEATMRVRSFFATGVNLTYAIGAIIGLIGAVKVYQKWNSGDPDTGKVAASWFGSCVFLVITATVLRSFFGV